VLLLEGRVGHMERLTIRENESPRGELPPRVHFHECCSAIASHVDSHIHQECAKKQNS